MTTVPGNLAPLPAHLRSINTNSQPMHSKPASYQPISIQQQTESLTKLLKNPSTEYIHLSNVPTTKNVTDYTAPINLSVPSRSKRRNNSRGLEMSLDSFDLTANDNNSIVPNVQITPLPETSSVPMSSPDVSDKSVELKLNQIIGGSKHLLRSSNLEKSLIAAFKNT